MEQGENRVVNESVDKKTTSLGEACATCPVHHTDNLVKLGVNMAKFDFVVMFRSYHHLGDLRRAGSVLSSITAAGSKVIITEDYKHIELKNSEKEAGGQPGRGFEHMRNHTARDAAHVLGEFGFEPEILWEPDRQSAGCWAVTAERRE